MTPEQLYLQHLQSIDRIAAFVARRNHLGPDDAAEFAQEVKVRLLEDDYAVIRKFEGRSSFTTYLTTVIVHLFHQYRIEQWGKWRPSAEAKRLGAKAITLERLITRDGYTYSEAVNVLTTPAGSQYNEAELWAIYIRLPHRTPRPVMVSGEVAPDAAAIDADALDHVEMADRERSARKTAKAIDGIFEAMDPQDRLILQMRFWHSLKVPDIARRLRIDQKKLYKRIDRLVANMRTALERAGVRKDEVGSFLNHGDHDFRFEIHPGAGEVRPMRPSQPTNGGNVRGGEDGLR